MFLVMQWNIPDSLGKKLKAKGWKCVLISYPAINIKKEKQ